eukprot:TRINITY_DN14774_c0_g1_i1.p1 TRINITY_DN14774_c0_g1~~TRINITY_DN14774_c0_g1_i1.p1  ORF type:complete len:186 (-),score=21.42 TRINITY_DN14774_c0_g1_i1:43-600(-)
MLFQRFLQLYVQHPYTASMVSVGTTSFLGDVICQKLLKSDGTWDPSRSINMGVMSTIMSPFITKYHFLLENRFPGKSFSAIAIKTMANGLVLGPLTIACMFAGVSFLEGKKKDHVKAKMQNDLLKTWMAAGIYWPGINMLIFKFVPVHYRPVAGGVASVIWSVFLSLQIHSQNVIKPQLVTGESP